MTPFDEKDLNNCRRIKNEIAKRGFGPKSSVILSHEEIQSLRKLLDIAFNAEKEAPNNEDD